MIVIEGPDNAGKSTLAHSVGLKVIVAGPPPKNEREELSCLEFQYSFAQSPLILDRATCISSQVYGARMFENHLSNHLLKMIRHPDVLVVYCRPPERVLMDMSNHQRKDYDTDEHMQKIIQNQHLYIKRYDELMRTIPHVMYDWTDDQINHDQLVNDLIDSQTNSTLRNRILLKYGAKPI